MLTLRSGIFWYIQKPLRRPIQRMAYDAHSLQVGIRVPSSSTNAEQTEQGFSSTMERSFDTYQDFDHPSGAPLLEETSESRHELCSAANNAVQGYQTKNAVHGEVIYRPIDGD